MAIKAAEKLQQLNADDASGMIEMVLKMIDDYVAASGNAWFKFLWRFLRGALTGHLPEPEPNAMVQAATSLDSLIEFVLTVIDKYVAESGRPMLAFAWRILRPYLQPAAISQATQPLIAHPTA